MKDAFRMLNVLGEKDCQVVKEEYIQLLESSEGKNTDFCYLYESDKIYYLKTFIKKGALITP